MGNRLITRWKQWRPRQAWASTFARAVRSEQGIAMPTVLMFIVAGMSLGGVSVVSSVDAQNGSARDEGSKEALAAAEAGAELALYRHNKVMTSSALPCVVPSLSGDLIAKAAQSDGWCEEVEGTVGDGSYSYRAQPAYAPGGSKSELELQVVSIGKAGGVARRLSVASRTKTGAGIFGNSALIGLNSILLNGSGKATGNAGSNGNIGLASSSQLCGDATYGYGHGISFAGSSAQCPGYVRGEGEFSLPPAPQGTVPPSAGGQNDNGRFWGLDTKSSNSNPWNASTRVMTLSGNETVTLGGTNYSFCQLTMSGNSALIAARGATVRIFFDSPENCGYTSTTTPYNQLSMIGSSQIIATSGNPKDLTFFFFGSDTIDTTATLTGNGSTQNEMYIYGPRTDVTLNGSADFYGAIGARSATVSGSGDFTGDPSPSDFDVSLTHQYKRTRFIECAGSEPMAPPNANC